MITRLHTILACLTLISVLYACTPAPFYEEMKTVNGTWDANDPGVFEFEISDTTQKYTMLMNLRHTEAYPYSNMYVFMQLDFPNGKKSVDTLECLLADPRGKWGGRSMGDLVDHRIGLRQKNEPVIFPLKGTYKVTITQAMREDPLREVMDIGFALEEWESN
ncbi:gliding motility lipoprotein GldH [Sanyastnella coralliicola]|uniref:gliding motility lipoprotein GldH n=1 Tax=Sanyastnella coralliicola TaxID=3069118 RepID=UPI0027B96EA5|nr:gliding motility lipoprotein GldH [Longitalea sp. SCSIO 12813]